MTDAWKRPWPERPSKSIAVTSLEDQDKVNIIAVHIDSHYTDSMIKPDYTRVVRHMTENKNLDSDVRKE